MVEDLSVCLWEERAALEQLVFRLEQENLVLASGRHRLLMQSTAEVAASSAAVDQVEQRRIELTAAIAADTGLAADATLEVITEVLDAPAAEALRSHRAALRRLVGLVTDLVQRNRELIARGLAATVDALTLVGAAPAGAYDASGTAPAGVGGALVYDSRV
ncbi:MAG TPA: flagellar export chaperone FlgN [Acidimicrobiales bacterium]|nr:flagellar export chaperone FlgN [Acidimicrobiales bacterium]